MKKYWLFAKGFLTNPGRNASVIPSSKYLTENICYGIDFETVDTIVEFGPGTGCFTEALIQQAKPETQIIVIDLNPEYCSFLEEKFGDRITVINDSALHLDTITENLDISSINLFVCGLGLVSMPKEVREGILDACLPYLQIGAIFRGFTYMPTHFKKTFEKYPISIIKKVLRNIPPAFVYEIKK